MTAPAPLILGGGLAGAAVAIRLAVAGARPHLLERSVGPHDKVCGEFLSGEAVDELQQLGLDPRALGAVPINRVRLWAGTRSAESTLPFPALSLSRRVLDEALLEAAAQAGAHVERGVRVAEAPPPPPGGLFVATGKAALRGVVRGRASGLVGYKMHYRVPPAAAAALAGVVEIVWLPHGYAGVQLIEGGVVNLCLVTRRPAPDALAREIAAAPRLAMLLRDAEPLFARPLTVANLPYGWVAAPEPDQPGRFRLGDQAAMIPSFTGDGMAIALTTARWAAEAYAAGGPAAADAYAARARAGLRRPVGIAHWTARLALTSGLSSPLVAAARAAPALARAIARSTRVRLVPSAAA